MHLKAVFSFGYFIVLFGSQEEISIEFSDSFVFLIMQSRQVKVGVREARHISEPIVVGIVNLEIS